MRLRSPLVDSGKGRKLVWLLVSLGWALCVRGASAEVEAVVFPPENPFSEAKRVLGKILFWEEQLSSDDTIACGTCHIPAAGGSDPRLGVHPGPDGVFDTDDDIIGSPGVVRRDANGQRVPDPVFGFEPQVTGRSAPSYFTGLHAEDLFWDGRARSTFLDPLTGAVVIPAGGGLESQAVAPILNPVEMAREGRAWPDVAEKLANATPLALATDLPADVAQAIAARPSYPELFAEAFSDPEITPVRIAFAIATYERTLVPDQTPWDLYRAGDQGALTLEQEIGWQLFNDSALCSVCHGAPNFTDDRFHTLGLRPADEDIGREAVTGDPDDFGRFRTASLRNVGLRSSLMHVGWIVDVQDAIDFYNAGRLDTGHVQFTADQTGIPLEDGSVQDLDTVLLSEDDQAFVIDFLVNGLTDPRVANEEFPFDRPTLRSELVPEPSALVLQLTALGLVAAMRRRRSKGRSRRPAQVQLAIRRKGVGRIPC